MKKILLILLVIIGVKVYPNDTFTVGVVYSNLKKDFTREIKRGIEKRSKEEDIKIMSLDSKGDMIEEYNNIKKLVEEKVDLLIIMPTNSYSVVKGIKLANDKNIPVVTVDRKAYGGKVVTEVGSNNVRGGRELADYIIKVCGRGCKVIELEGSEDLSTSKERTIGFNQEAIGNLKVISREKVGNDRKKSYMIMKRILNEEPLIDAVCVYDEESLLGAMDAIKESRREVFLVGYGRGNEVFKGVKTNNIDVVVKQDPFKIGKESIDVALNIKSKKWVNKKNIVDIEMITKKDL